MLPADELFSGGKLVPLRLPSSSEAATAATRPPLAPAPTTQQPETARLEPAKDAVVEAEQAAEEPKAPARRWRDLLRMRKQQASVSASSSSSSSMETKPLRRLRRVKPEGAVLPPPPPRPNDADMPPVGSNPITDRLPRIDPEGKLVMGFRKRETQEQIRLCSSVFLMPDEVLSYTCASPAPAVGRDRWLQRLLHLEDAVCLGGRTPWGADLKFLLAAAHVSTMLPPTSSSRASSFARLPSSSEAAAAMRSPLPRPTTQEQASRRRRRAEPTKDAVEASKATEEPKAPARGGGTAADAAEAGVGVVFLLFLTETKPLRRLLAMAGSRSMSLGLPSS
ncbi:hypothetical protein ZWY2020_034261 [Hordeum vulgare]|nr:hypothetical protein ZWY2020_034261 [Hordeum vulgare]